MDKEKIKIEIFKTEMELSMSNMNDGWWNNYMKKKLDNLKKLLENDNNRIFNKKN